MDNNIDNLKKLIENLKTLGFWQRIFRWKYIRQQLVDAVSDLQRLLTNSENLKEQNATLSTHNSELITELRVANECVTRQDGELAHLNSTIQVQASKLTQFAIDLSASETTIGSQNTRISQLTTTNSVLVENNTNLSTDNKRLAGVNATNAESITNLSKRKGELDIELAGIKVKLNHIEEELKK